MYGRKYKVFVDTGAKIHFIKKEALTNLEVVDTEMDFYPYLGEFQNGVYQLLLDYYLRWYTEHYPDRHSDAVWCYGPNCLAVQG